MNVAYARTANEGRELQAKAKPKKELTDDEKIQAYVDVWLAEITEIKENSISFFSSRKKPL